MCVNTNPYFSLLPLQMSLGYQFFYSPDSKIANVKTGGVGINEMNMLKFANSIPFISIVSGIMTTIYAINARNNEYYADHPFDWGMLVVRSVLSTCQLGLPFMVIDLLVLAINIGIIAINALINKWNKFSPTDSTGKPLSTFQRRGDTVYVL